MLRSPEEPMSVPDAPEALDYDVIVIGSGFGGSVSALRLTEKGYRVAVLEAGRRFADAEVAATSWRLSRYLFAAPPLPRRRLRPPLGGAAAFPVRARPRAARHPAAHPAPGRAGHVRRGRRRR